ncbi:MAG: DUF3656 domain-containing protein [Planctomycetota bacterium]
METFIRTTAKTPVGSAPELLAPAGDWECAKAAVENGADAIYFGLDCGFNARHRAKNFHLDDLPELMGFLRCRGVRGYTTMNTLVFPSELPMLIPVIESIAESGVDAVLIQDFGVARIVAAICPDIEIHASTQMSLTSAETISVAEQLGLARVVLARELSAGEITKIASATSMPLEVFIHGALCVAYSGQCLTSESLGGRSANRGQCAQACRLPYELVCDGEDVDLADVRYLLSPQDLAGYEAITQLIEAGIASLKIEGRLKTPEYVANLTGHYRRMIDQAVAEGCVTVSAEAQREMELSFSRGFSPGWLQGNDHKRLVPGDHSAKRGIYVGNVIQHQGDRVLVEALVPLSLGDGLAIESHETTGSERAMQGGRIYSLETNHPARQRKKSPAPTRHQSKARTVDGGSLVWIGFGRGEVDWQVIDTGAAVFKNDDPELNKRLRATYQKLDATARLPVHFEVHAEVGKPLRMKAESASQQVTVEGDAPLEVAKKHPATENAVREKLSRLGATTFRLGQLRLSLSGQPMIPSSVLNDLRRRATDELSELVRSAPVRMLRPELGRRLLDPIQAEATSDSVSQDGQLVVLCRTMEQAEAAAAAGAECLYLDFHDIRQYAEAGRRLNDLDVNWGIASIRMQKPGEMGLLKVLGRRQPRFILARNLAAIDFCRRQSIPFIADFSLNVANHRSAEWIRDLGAKRVTASYDLNRDQLLELVDSIPPSWLEVVIHQHIPMFHMEHCVFCSVLSPGTDKTNCGRPCDRHVVQLRDRVGAEHTLQADVACRNTLYNAKPQSGAEVTGDLRERGVTHFRIELLEEDGQRVTEMITLYRQLIAGQVSAESVWRKLSALNRVGVTRGTLESKRNPLAII